MSRKLLVLAFVCIACFMVLNYEAPAQETWGGSSSGTSETPVVTPDAGGPRVMGSLTWRQRRKMGLTIFKIRRVMKEMKAEGELAGVSQSEIAAEVLNRLMGEDPQAFADPSVNWDAVLEFIEKLIPIILRILEMFGGVDASPPLPFQYVDLPTPLSLSA